MGYQSAKKAGGGSNKRKNILPYEGLIWRAIRLPNVFYRGCRVHLNLTCLRTSNWTKKMQKKFLHSNFMQGSVHRCRCGWGYVQNETSVFIKISWHFCAASDNDQKANSEPAIPSRVLAPCRRLHQRMCEQINYSKIPHRECRGAIKNDEERAWNFCHSPPKKLGAGRISWRE